MFVKMKDELIALYYCQNVVIKYNTRVWREYLQQKYQIISRIINSLLCVINCQNVVINIK